MLEENNITVRLSRNCCISIIFPKISIKKIKLQKKDAIFIDVKTLTNKNILKRKNVTKIKKRKMTLKRRDSC